jgi:hypothetical protein
MMFIISVLIYGLKGKSYFLILSRAARLESRLVRGGFFSWVTTEDLAALKAVLYQFTKKAPPSFYKYEFYKRKPVLKAQ